MRDIVADTVEDKIRTICEWKEVEVLEMNVMPDHIHLACSIPPKLSVSEFMGLLRGKTAILLFKSYSSLQKKPYWGNHFGARGCFVSTVGIDEEKIKRYVKYQKDEDQKSDLRLL